jgi:hypothetical protein
MTKFHTCHATINNLRKYFEIYSKATPREELLALHHSLYDEKFKMSFNGKRFRSYEDDRANILKRGDNGYPEMKCCNFSAEILDLITFHYTHDFHEDGLPKDIYKIHAIATVNPNNGKIISMKYMTGQALVEICQFRERFHHDINEDENRNINTRSLPSYSKTSSITSHRTTNDKKIRSTNNKQGSQIHKLSSSAPPAINGKSRITITSRIYNGRIKFISRISEFLSTKSFGST